MTTTQLHAQFNQAINWNGLLYIIYRLSATATSFILYSLLPTEAFSAWATIQAVVFLSLLWLGCGLAKSIPRYAPFFATDTASLKQFSSRIIIFQMSLLMLALPVVLYILHSYFIQNPYYLICAGILFITEGLVKLLSLLYYAHFAQRQFNSIWSALLLWQTAGIGSILLLINDPMIIVMSTLLLRAGIGFILVGIASWRLHEIKPLYKAAPEEKPSIKEFVKHSGIMWGTTALKSLSERNFMVPLITATLGAGPANIFKVANDGALFFQRSIIKTMGTADTSLLTHSQLGGEGKNELPRLFEKVMTKLGALVIPLSGIFGLVLLHSPHYKNDSMIFTLFIILTLAYFFESLCMPFERVLEVTRNYLDLLIAYVPYVVILIYIQTSPLISSIGLINFVLVLYGVRLVSVLIMAYAAQRRYSLPFPFAFFLRRITHVFLLCLFLSYIYKVISPYLL